MRNISAHSAFAALILLLSACGGSPEAATSALPEVDITKLDSGNYPTTPIDVETTRSPHSGAALEAVRIGAVTPVPFDYDHRFVYAQLRIDRAITGDKPAAYPGTEFQSGKEALAAIPGVVAGWRTSGQRRDHFDAGRGISTMTQRFADSDQSRFAYEALGRHTKGVPDEIPGYPDAQVRVAITKGVYVTQYMRAWLVRGDMLIHVEVTDPVSAHYDVAANAEIVKRFFDKQLEMLEAYASTPVNEFDTLPLDVDGMMSRTLSVEKDTTGRVYPAQALEHLASRPDRLTPAMSDAGVDYASFATGSVYRTSDPAAAIRYMAAEEADSTTDPKYTQVDSPPNMPGAHCYNTEPGEKYTSSTPPICITTVGRFVIKSVGANIQDAHQRLAAQYKLLAGHH